MFSIVLVKWATGILLLNDILPLMSFEVVALQSDYILILPCLAWYDRLLSILFFYHITLLYCTKIQQSYHDVQFLFKFSTMCNFFWYFHLNKLSVHSVKFYLHCMWILFFLLNIDFMPFSLFYQIASNYLLQYFLGTHFNKMFHVFIHSSEVVLSVTSYPGLIFWTSK